MMNIKQALTDIRQQIPSNVTLVAVSKTKPISLLEEAYKAGQRIFGENKALEMTEKSESLPQDIQWHFIGHLQTNKVKYIAPYVALIHSVDSFKLLKKINAEAAKNNRIISVLLQFHIAEEDSKYGFNLERVTELLTSETYGTLAHVKIVGVMGMATFTTNESIVKAEFKTLKNIFDQLKEQYFLNDPSFKEVSMGMSGDFELAIAEGSTMVRVGSSIFGSRQ